MLLSKSSAVCALALLTPVAAAQLPTQAAQRGDEVTGVLFEETFERGIGRWSRTLSGANYLGPITFHLATDTSTCVQDILPFPSGNAARAGRETECDYETGGYVGETTITDLTLLTPIDLPANSTDLRFSFWSYDDVECEACAYDRREIYIAGSDDVWTYLGASERLGQWYQTSFDISAWAGDSVRLRFRFDTSDGIDNGGLGWLVDDVRVVDGWSTPVSYCDAAPNSVSATGAQLGFNGSLNPSDNDFTLTADGIPAGNVCYFMYGPKRYLARSFDGFMCVGEGSTGRITITPSAWADGSGHASHAVDFDASLLTSAWIVAGSTWNFQAYYRDLAGTTGWNYTDALQVTFSAP